MLTQNIVYSKSLLLTLSFSQSFLINRYKMGEMRKDQIFWFLISLLLVFYFKCLEGEEEEEEQRQVESVEREFSIKSFVTW